MFCNTKLTVPIRLTTICFSRTSKFNSTGLVTLMSSRNYNTIIPSTPKPGVKLITLNRPKSLNALNDELVNELITELNESDKDKEVGCIILTGSEKAFAAGADIKEMKSKTNQSTLNDDFLENWNLITKIQKPIIAAVDGYALGGGLEIVMMCDIIYATKNAKFGQPEINLGVIPGGGGTQRLIRSIGKSRAMEYILTGNMFNATDAETWGLVSKTFESNKDLLESSINLAEKISKNSRLAVKLGKRAVNSAEELTLSAGLNYEKIIFQGLFGTHDQSEGMDAFDSKRKPNWKI